MTNKLLITTLQEQRGSVSVRFKTIKTCSCVSVVYHFHWDIDIDQHCSISLSKLNILKGSDSIIVSYLFVCVLSTH